MTDPQKDEKLVQAMETGSTPKNTGSWFIDNAIFIMVAGFAILLVAAVTFTFVVNRPGIAKTITLWAGFSGFGVYMLGRVCLSIKRRSERKKRIEQTASSNGDDE